MSRNTLFAQKPMIDYFLCHERALLSRPDHMILISSYPPWTNGPSQKDCRYPEQSLLRSNPHFSNNVQSSRIDARPFLHLCDSDEIAITVSSNSYSLIKKQILECHKSIYMT